MSLTTSCQRVAASVSVGGFQRSTEHRAAIDGARFMESDPPKAMVCDKDGDGSGMYDSLTPTKRKKGYVSQ